MSTQLDLYPLAIGEYLKRKRMGRKWSLEEVAGAISLDVDLLRDIEADRAIDIAAVYKKGYVRAYAHHLKIPEKEISRLIKPIDASAVQLRTIFPISTLRNPIDRWLRGTSYVLASLLVGTLVWQFTHEAVRLSQNESLFNFGRENQQSRKELTDGRQTFSVPVNASITSLGALHATRAGGPDAAKQAWAALSQPALPEGESRLQVRVSADSWIEITDALGRELEMDLLRGGNEKVYQGRPPFRMLFGRAAAVRLTMDGEPVDLSAFTHENVARITWPKVTTQPQPE